MFIFCQIPNEPSKIAKESKKFTTLAKFRQIWSHWGGGGGGDSFKLLQERSVSLDGM